MRLITTISDLQNVLAPYKGQGTVGLVPTMGALHEGHISLVRRSKVENIVTVVSIFVNPTQFNDKNDLNNYPRTLDADTLLLSDAGVDFIFNPSTQDMYPSEDKRVFSFSPLDEVMEGPFRPGHFNGVAQIVSKLFYAVLPDKAYFGEKDFQQLAIIREMTKQLQLNIEIVPCPIVREKDGLAMSSRNTLLTPDEHQRALNISRILFASRDFALNSSVQQTISFLKDRINAIDGFKLEYFEIVDGYTLQPVSSWESSPYIVGCIALFCGKIRLIDNIKYKEENI